MASSIQPVASTEHEAGEDLDVKDRINLDSLLIALDDSGRIHCFLDGTYPLGAISLGDKKKGTVASLGIHRRHQTVYHKHGPEVAGKILLLKELLEVENVPDSQVKTKQQQREERKATRGYQIAGNKKATTPAWESQ